MTIAAYAIYAVASYVLCVDTLFCIMVLPKQQKALRAKLHTSPLLHRYMTDPAFKTRVSLFLSLAVNLLYAGVNVLSWALYRSMWFVVLAVYYAILSVMRFLLVRYIHRHPLGEDRLGELRRARLCSYILLLLNFVLTGAVMMILFVDKGFIYHGILIFEDAFFTETFDLRIRCGFLPAKLFLAQPHQFLAFHRFMCPQDQAEPVFSFEDLG